MRVFRVVDSEGFGYKRSLDSEILNWTEKGMSSLMFGDKYFEHRPMPKDDGLPITRIRKYHLFGFKNLAQLNKWFFPADLALGAILGGKIQVLEVSKSKMIHGRNQLVFDKRNAKLIEEFPMNNFLNDELKCSEFDFLESYKEGLEMDIEPPARLVEYFS